MLSLNLHWLDLFECEIRIEEELDKINISKC